MEIWLPERLYKLKPLLLILAASLLMLSSDNLLVMILSMGLVGYALWIMFMRLIWGNTRVIKY